MQAIIATFIIIVAILADYFWFDANKKRWGWMRDWSTLSKVFFFSGFVIVSGLVYLGLSTEYFS